jgi:hypothetical protein
MSEPDVKVDPPQTNDRLVLVEWRLTQLEKTMSRMVQAAWSVVVAVIAGAILYYLTSKGATPR